MKSPALADIADVKSEDWVESEDDLQGCGLSIEQTEIPFTEKEELWEGKARTTPTSRAHPLQTACLGAELQKVSGRECAVQDRCAYGNRG